jgi:hypothetical protein
MKDFLPLDQMTTEEKLLAMEQLWEDLSRTPEQLPSPAWHGEILAKRERGIADGTARFLSLEEVLATVRKTVGR